MSGKKELGRDWGGGVDPKRRKTEVKNQMRNRYRAGTEDGKGGKGFASFLVGHKDTLRACVSACGSFFSHSILSFAIKAPEPPTEAYLYPRAPCVNISSKSVTVHLMCCHVDNILIPESQSVQASVTQTSSKDGFRVNYLEVPRTSAYIYYRLFRHNDNTCCKTPGRTAAVSQILQLLCLAFCCISVFPRSCLWLPSFAVA